MRIVMSMVALTLWCGIAVAQPSTDAQVRNSYLALSAFECAVLAKDPKEAERLFNIGLKVGREFVEFARKNPDVYQSSISSKVAILWNLTSGPTTDFVLGQIYGSMTQEVYKEYSPDKDVWEIKKQNMSRAKNCSLIGSR